MVVGRLKVQVTARKLRVKITARKLNVKITAEPLDDEPGDEEEAEDSPEGSEDEKKIK